MISQSATVYITQLSADDRWEPYRCATNRRTIDVNHARSQIRYFCDRCRATHTVDVGTRYTTDSESA